MIIFSPQGTQRTQSVFWYKLDPLALSLTLAAKLVCHLNPLVFSASFASPAVNKGCLNV